MKGSVFIKKEVKIIFHIDLNAFFASCAAIKEPYLKGRPFAIGRGHGATKGIITAASYEARKLGIKSAMSVAEALRIYPKLLIVPSDYSFYYKQSKIFFNFLRQYTDMIVEGSIDEGYLDLTALSKTRHPMSIAKEIQNRLLNEYQLPVSIGIAPTLFLAKMASDLKKPLGITVIRKKDIVEKLFPLPIEETFGIGRKNAPRLKKLGINTIGAFTKKANKGKILTIMSEQNYESYLCNIMGQSSDVVDPKKYAIPKSISNEITLNYDLDNTEELLEFMIGELKTSYNRLVKEDMKCKTVNIKMKDNKFKLTTRAFTLDDYTDDYRIIENAVRDLFEANYDNTPLRLVGAGMSNLILNSDYKVEINLFNYQELTKREQIIFTKKKSV